MTDRLSLVWSPCTTSGQETERVYFYNPGARTGLSNWQGVKPRNLRLRTLTKHRRYCLEIWSKSVWVIQHIHMY